MLVAFERADVRIPTSGAVETRVTAFLLARLIALGWAIVAPCSAVVAAGCSPFARPVCQIENARCRAAWDEDALLLAVARATRLWENTVRSNDLARIISILRQRWLDRERHETKLAAWPILYLSPNPWTLDRCRRNSGI